MADKNIIERVIVPYNPSTSKVLQKDKYNLYAPAAGNGKVGMAGFDTHDFTIKDQIVRISNAFQSEYVRRVDATKEMPALITFDGVDGKKTQDVLFYNYTNVVADANTDKGLITKTITGAVLVTYTGDPTSEHYQQNETFLAEGRIWCRTIDIINGEVEENIPVFIEARGLAALQFSGIPEYRELRPNSILVVAETGSSLFNRSPIKGDKLLYAGHYENDTYLIGGEIVGTDEYVMLQVEGLQRLDTDRQFVAYAIKAEEADKASAYTAGGKIDQSIKYVKELAGHTLEMTVDDNYILTVNLVNSAGIILSTASVDLPIESVVMNMTYANKKLTLILENGNRVDVDISDVIAGLVPETRTINGKPLSADITLIASDVNAYDKTETYNKTETGNLIDQKIDAARPTVISFALESGVAEKAVGYTSGGQIDKVVKSLGANAGHTLEVLVDDNYVLTVNLKNTVGEILSTGSVDLPIESMVVDGTYANGIVTLTLQNGNTIPVDVSALISGLVPETRTINGKPLSANITLVAADVNAYDKTETYNKREVFAKSETYGKNDVYRKTETYPKTDVYTKNETDTAINNAVVGVGGGLPPFAMESETAQYARDCISGSKLDKTIKNILTRLKNLEGGN